MSRDDYISKLFSDNEHKLEEAPSNDLWGRLEAKLDQDLPVQDSPAQDGIMKVVHSKGASALQFGPYMAAASVLVLIVSVVAILQFTGNNTSASDNHQLAMELNNEVEDIELRLDEAEPLAITEAEKEALFEDEVKKQEEKILRSVSSRTHSTTSTESPSINDVEIVEVASNDLIVLEPATAMDIPEPEEAVMEVAKTTAAPSNFSFANSINDADMGNATVVEKTTVKPTDFRFKNNAYDEIYQNRNYGVPPSADPALASKLDEIEDELSNSKAEQPKKTYKSRNKRGLRLKNKSKSRSKQPNKMHPRIQMFDWMLGEFQDTERSNGKSIETWRMINPNTIEGVGVLMKGKDKIFEEKIQILFDPSLKQVLLNMRVDDSNNYIQFTLSSFDTERIIFEQVESNKYPNKIIFQRMMNGFTTIVQQDSGFIEGNQQIYLEKRNHVSNVRAIRNLEAVD